MARTWFSGRDVVLAEIRIPLDHTVVPELGREQSEPGVLESVDVRLHERTAFKRPRLRHQGAVRPPLIATDPVLGHVERSLLLLRKGVADSPYLVQPGLELRHLVEPEVD